MSVAIRQTPSKSATPAARSRCDRHYVEHSQDRPVKLGSADFGALRDADRRGGAKNATKLFPKRDNMLIVLSAASASQWIAGVQCRCIDYGQ
jgi:hypothetical protein